MKNNSHSVPGQGGGRLWPEKEAGKRGPPQIPHLVSWQSGSAWFWVPVARKGGWSIGPPHFPHLASPSPHRHHFEEALFFRVSFLPPHEETRLPNGEDRMEDRRNGLKLPREDGFRSEHRTRIRTTPTKTISKQKRHILINNALKRAAPNLVAGQAINLSEVLRQQKKS